MPTPSGDLQGQKRKQGKEKKGEERRKGKKGEERRK
jgi:hypothetical protein